jgi:hypothetical protein
VPQVVTDRKINYLTDGEFAKQGMGKLVLVEIVLQPFFSCGNKLVAGIPPFQE